MALIRKFLLNPLEAIIAACLATMLVLVFLNIVLRYAFNTGITVTEELSRLLFVWMVFLGAAVALFERAHLGVDTLILALNRTGRLICFVVANALMLGLTWLIYSGSWQQAEINLGSTTPVLGASQALYFLPVLIFAVISAGWFAVMLLRALLGRLSDDELAGLGDDAPQSDAGNHP